MCIFLSYVKVHVRKHPWVHIFYAQSHYLWTQRHKTKGHLRVCETVAAVTHVSSTCGGECVSVSWRLTGNPMARENQNLPVRLDCASSICFCAGGRDAWVPWTFLSRLSFCVNQLLVSRVASVVHRSNQWRTVQQLKEWESFNIMPILRNA